VRKYEKVSKKLRKWAESWESVQKAEKVWGNMRKCPKIEKMCSKLRKSTKSWESVAQAEKMWESIRKYKKV